MLLYSYRYTEHGAKQRAAERGLSFPAPKTPRIAPSAPTAVPVANNVVRLVTPRDKLRWLIDRVGAWHGVSVDEILSDDQRHHIIEARYDAIAAVWMNCRLAGSTPTTVSMGRLFDRNHSSINAALRKRGCVVPARTKFPKKQRLRPWRMKCK